MIIHCNNYWVQLVNSDAPLFNTRGAHAFLQRETMTDQQIHRCVGGGRGGTEVESLYWTGGGGK